MNLVPCPDCGRQVSGSASSCPHCGRSFVAASAPAPEKKSAGCGTISLVIIGSVFALVVIVGQFQPAPALPEELNPAQEAEKAERENRFRAAVIAASAIKRALRDPESVRWDRVYTNSDATAICLEYRARNGFGGMNHEFTVVYKGIASQDPDIWNKRCVGKGFYDQDSIQYAIR